MLYEMEAKTCSNNLPLIRGRMWREDGVLLATIYQQGLVRARL